MKIAFGSLATSSGERPSSLISWTEEEDWFGRLMFDMEVIHCFRDAENKAQKKAMRRR
jgi:hypothetical protein